MLGQAKSFFSPFTFSYMQRCHVIDFVCKMLTRNLRLYHYVFLRYFTWYITTKIYGKDVHYVQYFHVNIFYITGESLCHERWYSWSCRSRHECCGCVVQCSSSSADCWLLRLRSSNISSIWVSYLIYFQQGETPFVHYAKI